MFFSRIRTYEKEQNQTSPHVIQGKKSLRSGFFDWLSLLKAGIELSKSALLVFVCFFLLVLRLSAQPDQPLFGCSGIIEESQTNPSDLNGSCSIITTNFIANHANELVPVGSPAKIKLNINIIFVQNSLGVGNFQVSNAEHLAHYNAAVAEANAKLNSLFDNGSNTGNCVCNAQPDYYESAYIELVPNYVEIQSDYYFDHMNDPAVSGLESKGNTSRPFIAEIVNLAKQQPSYAPGGINWVITNHGTAVMDLLNSPPGVGHWQIPSLTEPFNGLVYATSPSTNLTKDMNIHFADGFVRYLGFTNFYAPNYQWFINDRWVPFIGYLLAHEVSHLLGLFDILGAQNCPENIMNNTNEIAVPPSTKVNLTGCQIRQMFQALHTRNSRNAIVCENALENDLIVDQNETWNNNLRILGDVVVKNGATLTVTCEVHMSPNGKMIVERGGKLVVDGGLLTGDCSQYWKGIIVEGDAPGLQAQSGVVELKNGAVVEHARDAVSMNPTHLPWSPSYQSYFGGIIKAENATIRKCRRGVEFMKYGYGGIKDVSYFKNVTFEDLEEGVTDWADDGVSFERCTFKNISNRGIHPYDCEVIVEDGNVFTGTLIGVDIVSTYPTIFSTRIGSADGSLQRNAFNCQQYGVYAKAGSNSAPLTILNNDFAQSVVGFHQDGNGQFQIRYNSFNNPGRGVQFYDCGNNENIVSVNRIGFAHVGANSNQVNTGLKYWGNCFQSNALVDINNQNGSIHPYQGDPFNSIAAGNCFEGASGKDISNVGGTLPLTYFLAVNTPTSSCKYPDNNPGPLNYSVSATMQNDLFGDCSDLPFFTSGGGENACNLPENASIADLVSARQQILSQLNALPGLYSPGSWELDYWTYFYQNCMQKIDDRVGQKSFELGSEDPLANKEAAITYFNSQGDFLNKTTAYGIMVTFGEYGRAKAYLDTLTTQNAEEANFKWVQNINVDYLQDRFEYQLSEENRQQLAQIGKTDGPYNGYARSLYEVLTGERLEVVFAAVEESESTERDQAESQNQPAISIFPNPVRHGKLNIAVSGLRDAGDLRVELFDMQGRLSVQQTVASDGNHTLEVGNLPSGVYYLKVSTAANNTVLHQTKVALVH